MFHYNCPLCNANMQFNTDKGILTCEKCGDSISITNVFLPEYGNEKISSYNSQTAAKNLNEDSGDLTDIENIISTGTFNKDFKAITCNKCGAVLIDNDKSSSITCPFCGESIITPGAFPTHSAPISIIPFAVSKEDAYTAYKRWSHSNHFTPSAYKNTYMKRGLTALYIPIWRYEMYGCGEISAVGSKITDQMSKKHRTTHTDYYDIFRRNDYSYSNISLSASDKVSNEVISNLGIYSFDKSIPFNESDTNGLLITGCTYSNERAAEELTDRQLKQINSSMLDEITGYSSLHTTDQFSDIQQQRSELILVPVWMFSANYLDKEHTFYMNGQTGVITGKPPVSAIRFTGLTLVLGLIIFLIIQIILYLTGFTIL